MRKLYFDLMPDVLYTPLLEGVLNTTNIIGIPKPNNKIYLHSNEEYKDMGITVDILVYPDNSSEFLHKFLIANKSLLADYPKTSFAEILSLPFFKNEEFPDLKFFQKVFCTEFHPETKCFIYDMKALKILNVIITKDSIIVEES